MSVNKAVEFICVQENDGWYKTLIVLWTTNFMLKVCRRVKNTMRCVTERSVNLKCD
jgi:hypothetical protein